MVVVHLNQNGRQVEESQLTAYTEGGTIGGHLAIKGAKTMVCSLFLICHISSLIIYFSPRLIESIVKDLKPLFKECDIRIWGQAGSVLYCTGRVAKVTLSVERAIDQEVVEEGREEEGWREDKKQKTTRNRKSLKRWNSCFPLSPPHPPPLKRRETLITTIFLSCFSFKLLLDIVRYIFFIPSYLVSIILDRPRQIYCAYFTIK